MVKTRNRATSATPTIAVLGLGRMGSALVRGLLSRGAVQPSQIVGTHHDWRRAKRAGRLLGVVTTTDNAAAVAQAGLVILCVRPGQIADLLREISDHVSLRHVMVSTAVGVPLRWMQARLGKCKNVYHVHPPSFLVAGASGPSFIAHANGASPAAGRTVARLFEALGPVIPVAEKDIDACAVFSGCAPAFCAQMSLIWEGLACDSGIPSSRAKQITAHILGGMATACERGRRDLHALIDMIATPGGVTEVGVRMLRDGTAEHLLQGIAEQCLRKISAIRRQFAGGE